MSDRPIQVDLEHVSKSYCSPGAGSQIRVLQDVCLSVAAGASLAVMGPSGSGKSTLLNIVGALDRPSSGTALLNGRDLSSLTDRELALLRNVDIGFVFQLHHLLPQCTVLENILLPTIPCRRGRAAAAVMETALRLLDRVGLKHRANHRPGELSGGERQRTAVARALVNRPGLVLADEPTGSLDRASAHDIGRLLVDLNREENVTLIVVTHSTELAGAVGRQMELSEGVLRQAKSV